MLSRFQPVPALLALALAATLALPASAQQLRGVQTGQTSVQSSTMHRVSVGVGMSVPVDLPTDAQDVIIADPKIANAIVRSSRKAFVVGVKLGTTNIFFLDAEGRQIVGLAINVGQDLTHMRSTLRQLVPGSDIHAETVGDSVVISGSVSGAAEAQQVIDVAARLVGDEKKVVNALSLRGKDQVHLKVTVAEIQRTALKQLGVNLSAFNTAGTVTGPAGGLMNSGGFLFGALTQGSFKATGTTPTSNITLGSSSSMGTSTAAIRALEENGLFRTLAEPTLTAISGEQAKFLAGGEFPIPAGRDSTGNITIEYKPFGVSLAFTPVVLSEGRISLRVGTEVSEISSEVSVTLANISVPGLRIRRADTTIELPSGGSMIIGGLLQEQTRQVVSGQPGLMNLPVLGALFRSRDYQRGQTEIVVIATPYIVKPTSVNNLKRPDDNFNDAGDPAALLMGRLNAIYGTGSRPSQKPAYNGSFGFNRD